MLALSNSLILSRCNPTIHYKFCLTFYSISRKNSCLFLMEHYHHNKPCCLAVQFDPFLRTFNVLYGVHYKTFPSDMQPAAGTFAVNIHTHTHIKVECIRTKLPNHEKGPLIMHCSLCMICRYTILTYIV